MPTWSADNDERSFGLHADGNAEEVLAQGLVGGNAWRQLSSPDVQLQLILHHLCHVIAGHLVILKVPAQSVQGSHFLQEVLPQRPAEAEVVDEGNAEQQGAVHQWLVCSRDGVRQVLAAQVVVLDEEAQHGEDTLQVSLAHCCLLQPGLDKALHARQPGLAVVTDLW